MNNSAQSILLVDDDPDILELMKDILECEGYKTVLAADGLMGTLKVKNQEFDLIISDLNMPKQNGITFLNNISKDRIMFGKKLPPIIIITGEVTPLAKEICTKGKIPVLEKPFSSEALIEQVKITLEKSQVASEKKVVKNIKKDATTTSIILKKDQRMFEVEAILDNMYLLKEGHIVLRDKNDKDIESFNPGEIIGTAAAITSLPSPVYAVALEPSVLSIVPVSRIKKILKDQPNWFHSIILSMAKENLKLQSK